MRTYYKVFLSPSGLTIAEDDLWGNYDVRALMLDRVSKENAITNCNFLAGESYGLKYWGALDENDTVMFRIDGQTMAFEQAYGGLRLYENHPLN